MSLDPDVDPEPAADADLDAATTLALAEAKATFEYQVQRLREIDSKAIELLKANLLIIGVFVTALSIVGQAGLDVAAFVNVHTGVGALLLLVSTAIAGVTYTASNLRGGVDRTALEAALADEAFAETLLRSYGEWIEHNAEVTAVNDALVTVTVLLVIDAFVYFVAGVAAGALGLSTAAVAASFLGLTLALAPANRLAYHMDHIDATGRPPADAETFEGIRLSKGGSRSRGHDSLRRMLRGGDEE
ncbi:hypothetical protein [Salinilacihabitans rarus]|uniref:hypothetical protein n=1 Tax=Salinilacihabitans rarus TaxID=2961596 RepID=UPI0020C8E422|nr:hypothetical protein [Salinilacihabitans rarus]